MIAPTQEFTLDTRLLTEAVAQIELPRCRMILRNEHRLPWLILVPRRKNVSELHELLPAEQALVLAEMSDISAALKAVTKAKKINTAIFGNMVPQLHIHIVARFENDPFWPGSAVGVGLAQPYTSTDTPPWWHALLARR